MKRALLFISVFLLLSVSVYSTSDLVPSSIPKEITLFLNNYTFSSVYSIALEPPTNNSILLLSADAVNLKPTYNFKTGVLRLEYNPADKPELVALIKDLKAKKKKEFTLKAGWAGEGNAQIIPVTLRFDYIPSVIVLRPHDKSNADTFNFKFKTDSFGKDNCQLPQFKGLELLCYNSKIKPVPELPSLIRVSAAKTMPSVDTILTVKGLDNQVRSIPVFVLKDPAELKPGDIMPLAYTFPKNDDFAKREMTIFRADNYASKEGKKDTSTAFDFRNFPTQSGEVMWKIPHESEVVYYAKILTQVNGKTTSDESKLFAVNFELPTVETDLNEKNYEMTIDYTFPTNDLKARRVIQISANGQVKKTYKDLDDAGEIIWEAPYELAESGASFTTKISTMVKDKKGKLRYLTDSTIDGLTAPPTMDFGTNYNPKILGYKWVGNVLTKIPSPTPQPPGGSANLPAGAQASATTSGVYVATDLIKLNTGNWLLNVIVTGETASLKKINKIVIQKTGTNKYYYKYMGAALKSSLSISQNKYSYTFIIPKKYYTEAAAGIGYVGVYAGNTLLGSQNWGVQVQSSSSGGANGASGSQSTLKEGCIDRNGIAYCAIASGGSYSNINVAWNVMSGTDTGTLTGCRVLLARGTSVTLQFSSQSNQLIQVNNPVVLRGTPTLSRVYSQWPQSMDGGAMHHIANVIYCWSPDYKVPYHRIIIADLSSGFTTSNCIAGNFLS